MNESSAKKGFCRGRTFALLVIALLQGCSTLDDSWQSDINPNEPYREDVFETLFEYEREFKKNGR